MGKDLPISTLSRDMFYSYLCGGLGDRFDTSSPIINAYSGRHSAGD